MLTALGGNSPGGFIPIPVRAMQDGKSIKAEL
jgi:hypothetical protein